MQTLLLSYKIILTIVYENAAENFDVDTVEVIEHSISVELHSKWYKTIKFY